MKVLLGNIKGPKGTSVTVKSVTQSTEDGGVSIIEFSDGTILLVKNGETGPTYALTDSDRAAIAELVKADLTPDTWTFTMEDDSIVTKEVVIA